MTTWTKDELEQLNWTELREIAESLGISKPDDGWKASIPLILESQNGFTEPEFTLPMQSVINEVPAPQESPDPAIENILNRLQPVGDIPQVDYTGWFPKYPPGTPTCSRCGSKRLTDTNGEYICAVNDSNCPILR